MTHQAWVKRLGYAIVVTLIFSVSTAFGGDDSMDTIQRLEKMIQMQQEQIAAQAQMLEGLKQELEALKQKQVQQDQAIAEKAAESPKVVSNKLPDTKVTLYGQVNKGLLVTNDGNETNYYFVDNDNASTRVGIDAGVKATEDIDVGAKIEVEIQSNDSDKVNQEETAGVGDVNFRRRQLYGFLKSKRFGEFNIGWGSTASDGTAEIDLSGTSVVGYSSVASMAGGHFFYDRDNDALSDTRINDVFTNFDGIGRRERLRYDSPRFYNFRLSGSVINGDSFDLALRYAAKLGQFKLAAAIAYVDPGDLIQTAKDQVNGSLSILHETGLNFTFAAGTRSFEDNQRDRADFYYGKLGYRADFFSLGKTSFAVDYSRTKNFAQNDDEAKAFGVFAVQDFARWGSEYYIGYRRHQLDRVATNFKDIDALLTGVRVKF